MNKYIDKVRKSDRLYELGLNQSGREMKIVEYKNAKNIIIEFDNGIKASATYQQFKNGEIRNAYDKMTYNVGYIGEGNHKCSNEFKNPTKKYETWKGMLRRCYDEKYIQKNKTYEECSVCDEWLCFQNFGDWFDNNYYEVDNEQMHLDKDILYKHNKVYSQNTCIFVPNEINSLFIKSNKSRGEYPIGVHLNKASNKFHAQYSRHMKKTYIGSTDTVESAFILYKEFKEKYIKQVATLYKDKIPQILYDSMNNYVVEIDD